MQRLAASSFSSPINPPVMTSPNLWPQRKHHRCREPQPKRINESRNEGKCRSLSSRPVNGAAVVSHPNDIVDVKAVAKDHRGVVKEYRQTDSKKNEANRKRNLSHDARSGLTFRISDPAPQTFAMEPRRNRGVRCSRFVRRCG